MLTGMFVGGVRGTGRETAEAWLGTDLEMTTIFIEKSDWTGWKSAINFAAPLAKEQGVTPLFSIPLITDTSTLQAAAAHDYDANYVFAAQKLVAQYGQDETIHVRLGNELNADYFSWSAINDPEAFAQAYRNAVDAFRSVSGNFTFEWNIATAKAAMDPATAYPGDDYVDYIGGDFYYGKSTGTTIEAAKFFQYLVNAPYGLQWIEDFAAAHGKQTAYSEWGMNSANGGPFIALATQWFDTHDVAYANYWNSNASFRGMISNGQYGAAGEVYKAMLATGADPAGADVTRNWTGAGTNDYFGQEAPNVNYLADGGGGNDVLAFGHGANTIAGGGGADNIYVGNGDNIIYGNSATGTNKDGNDTIMAGGGSNLIDGQGGADTITVGVAGSTGDNSLNGGTGNDSIIIRGEGDNIAAGGAGNNLIDASAATGSNLLTGGAGSDMLHGGTGDDRLVAGTGSDHVSLMTGGAGADVFDFSAAGSAAPTMTGATTTWQEITDFLPGTDRIDLAFTPSAGDLLSSPLDFATPELARIYAQILIEAHSGATDIAALQVGGDSFLFYRQAGIAGPIDSVLKLDGVASDAVSYRDFA